MPSCRETGPVAAPRHAQGSWEPLRRPGIREGHFRLAVECGGSLDVISERSIPNQFAQGTRLLPLLCPARTTTQYSQLHRDETAKGFRTFADSAENVTESRQRESGFMAGGHQLRSIMIYLFGAAMDCPFTTHLMK